MCGCGCIIMYMYNTGNVGTTRNARNAGNASNCGNSHVQNITYTVMYSAA